MPTTEEAARLEQAARDVLARSGSHQGHWPDSVRVDRAEATVEEGALVVRVWFSDARCPKEQLGAAFELSEMFWVENDGVLDDAWAADHVLSGFGEATFAGGNPCTWERATDGVRWYRDRLL